MALDAKRLGKLLSLARQQEEKRAHELARTLNEKKAAEQKLVQLEEFHREYETKMRAAEKISIDQMLNHRGFLSQLSVAVTEQTGRNTALEQAMEPVYNAWLHERNRRRSIEDSKSDAEQFEREQADQREQKVLDDLSARPRVDDDASEKLV